MNRPINQVVSTPTDGVDGFVAGRVISCKCTVAGDVTFTLALNGDQITEALAVGSNWFQLAVTRVDLVGGTAATFKNLN